MTRTKEEINEIHRSVGERVLSNITRMNKARAARKRKWYARRSWNIGNFSVGVGLQGGRYEVSAGIDTSDTALFWIELLIIGIEYEHSKEQK